MTKRDPKTNEVLEKERIEPDVTTLRGALEKERLDFCEDFFIEPDVEFFDENARKRGVGIIYRQAIGLVDIKSPNPWCP